MASKIEVQYDRTPVNYDNLGMTWNTESQHQCSGYPEVVSPVITSKDCGRLSEVVTPS